MRNPWKKLVEMFPSNKPLRDALARNQIASDNLTKIAKGGIVEWDCRKAAGVVRRPRCMLPTCRSCREALQA